MIRSVLLGRIGIGDVLLIRTSVRGSLLLREKLGHFNRVEGGIVETLDIQHIEEENNTTETAETLRLEPIARQTGICFVS